jgi:hypothetical protein
MTQFSRRLLLQLGGLPPCKLSPALPMRPDGTPVLARTRRQANAYRCNFRLRAAKRFGARHQFQLIGKKRLAAR